MSEVKIRRVSGCRSISLLDNSGRGSMRGQGSLSAARPAAIAALPVSPCAVSSGLLRKVQEDSSEWGLYVK